jgi:PAS domain S-box-containing protein
VLNRTPEEVFPAEIAHAMTERHLTAFAASGPITSEYSIDLVDGRRWFHTVFVPLPEQPGSPRRIAAFGRDITDTVLARQELMQSEKRFQQAFLASQYPLSISYLDTSKFLEVNTAFCTLVGWSREELLGQSALSLNIWVNPDDRETIAAKMRLHRRVEGIEVQIRSPHRHREFPRSDRAETSRNRVDGFRRKIPCDLPLQPHLVGPLAGG